MCVHALLCICLSPSALLVLGWGWWSTLNCSTENEDMIPRLGLCIATARSQELVEQAKRSNANMKSDSNMTLSRNFANLACTMLWDLQEQARHQQVCVKKVLLDLEDEQQASM